MILDEIIVHDFGLYAGRQKILLTPPEPQRPIILIGGLNGHGKTTILDALQLCLYGKFASISNRNDLSYHEYLSRCICRSSLTKEASVEIAFRHTADGKENHYRLHRSWRIRNNVCREHFEVLKNRRREDALAENWMSYVEDLMPANISSLFLFDGEQVESYASPEKSSRLIGTAIRNLLGLDVVDQLEKDLIVYSRRKRAEDKSDPKNHEIEEQELALKELRTKFSNIKQDQAALKTKHLDPTHRTLRAVDKNFRELGGELYDQRDEIENKLSTANKVVEEQAERLRKFAVDALPLVLVRDLLKSIHARDKEEVKTIRSQQVATILESRDNAVIKEMQLQGVESKTINNLQAFLIADRNEYYRQGDRETVLNLTPDVRAELDVLLRFGLDELIGEVIQRLKTSSDAVRAAEDARLNFLSIPNDDAISEIMERRDALFKSIKSMEHQYSVLEEELNKLGRECERREKSLLQAIESEITKEGERQDRARILRHSARVRVVIESFRKTVINQHIQNLSYLVLESYQQLLRKNSLVTHLEINPDTFGLTLFSHDGKVLGTERLSAGERQLLAVALLWGLAKASGRALPTAIDTPLGRLDADHRKLLVERYFPFASHQVILLSTDEEICGKYFEALAPCVGRNYVLNYDELTGITTVTEGYFDQLEAA